MSAVPLFIDGQFVASKTESFLDVHDPATQAVVARTPLPLDSELEAAVQSAKRAFPAWRDTSISRRVRIMMKAVELLRSRTNDLAEIIVREHGKTMEDAKGEIQRAIEVVEYACSANTLLLSDMAENVATCVDTYSLKQPLGVTATISPFNFPVYCIFFSLPIALVCGNTVVLKPSERVPSAAIALATLFKEAGLPDGVLTLVHGAVKTVNFLCDHPDIKTVSFVGSNAAGSAIYSRASATGKRVQCNMGAKNHMVILADADKNMALNALLSSAFGASGQRCMAISVAVLVGKAQEWLPELVERAKRLIVGPGKDPRSDLGPVTTPAAKQRICGVIQRAAAAGADVLLDGSNVSVAGFEQGNFIGPTIIASVRADMECYRAEVFGPVLSVVSVDSLAAAIDFVNANPFGNGTSIFTRSGAAARKFQHDIEVGQIGINMPIPVPMPFFSWTGSKSSFAGDIHFYGKSGFQFFTKTKTVVASWKEELLQEDRNVHTAADLSFPTMK